MLLKIGKACNLIKKSLQHRCLPIKFTKFLRAPFFYRRALMAAFQEIEFKVEVEVCLVHISQYSKMIQDFTGSCLQKHYTKIEVFR